MKEVICKLSLLLLSLRIVNSVTHSSDAPSVVTDTLLAKDRHKPGRRFHVCTISSLLLRQVSYSDF
jgi:hypothetical protein